jgi:hypothetical protein
MDDNDDDALSALMGRFAGAHLVLPSSVSRLSARARAAHFADAMSTVLPPPRAGITVVDEADLQKQFASILGIAPAEAQFFLQAANNNLAGAINLYLEATESQRNELREPQPAAAGGAMSFGMSGSGMSLTAAAGRSLASASPVSDEDELLSAAIAASMGAPVSAGVVSTQEYVLGADGRIVGAGRAQAAQAAVFDFGRFMDTGGQPPQPEGGSSMDQG